VLVGRGDFFTSIVLGVNWFMVEPLRRLSHEHNS
jgi:hypothetical protein